MTAAFTLTWNGKGVEAKIASDSKKGSQSAADHLLKIASSLAPLDKGDLRSSGKVTLEDSAALLSFGGSPSKGVIATVQHERLDFYHPRGGQAKYVQKPMISEARAMFNVIRAEMKL
ncbi:MAG: hypothetical protein ACREOZ_02230 [Gloeomargaritales cyanobacterium]